MQIDDTTVIWRYFGFQKFLKLLQSKSLYFRRADLLKKEDPYELTLDRIGYASMNLVQSHLKSIGFPPSMTEINLWDEVVTKKFYINCWHINDHESYLMWKSYAPDGVAIKTTVERLKNCISKNNDFRVDIKKVIYEDCKDIASPNIEILTRNNNVNATTNPIQGIVARKVKQFKDESELRL